MPNATDASYGHCVCNAGCANQVFALLCAQSLIAGTSRYMGDSCEHEQKSLSTAFTLSFLLGNMYTSSSFGAAGKTSHIDLVPNNSGADRLYMGYVGSGVAKLLINLFLCIFPCCPLWYRFRNCHLCMLVPVLRMRLFICQSQLHVPIPLRRASSLCRLWCHCICHPRIRMRCLAMVDCRTWEIAPPD